MSENKIKLILFGKSYRNEVGSGRVIEVVRTRFVAKLCVIIVSLFINVKLDTVLVICALLQV